MVYLILNMKPDKISPFTRIADNPHNILMDQLLHSSTRSDNIPEICYKDVKTIIVAKCYIVPTAKHSGLS